MEYKIVLYCGLFLVFLAGVLLGYLLRAKFHKWDTHYFTKMPMGGIYTFKGMINAEPVDFMLFARVDTKNPSSKHFMIVKCDEKVGVPNRRLDEFRFGHSYKRTKEGFFEI